MKRLFQAALLLPAILAITACDTALTVGSKTIGFRSGEFIYSEGYLRTNYSYPFDRVWAACEKTMTDLKATDLGQIRKIASGSLIGIIQDEKVKILVDYVDKGVTTVSVMAGTGGNNLASQLIHERIELAIKGR